MGMESKLAKLQARVAAGAGRRFTHKCVVQVPNETIDARGGTHEAYADVSPAVELPCIYDSENGKQIVVAGKAESVTAYKFTFPAVWEGEAVEIQSKFHLRLLASPPLSERIFRVEMEGDKSGVLVEVLAVLVESDNT